MKELYIGLMSGTSVDGIDAAIVDFSSSLPYITATHYTPYPPELRDKILALCQQGENEIHRLGELDVLLAKKFAQAVNELLKKKSVAPQSIQAIGSHGQTIRHYPHQPHRFTLQIGDPNTIAAETGITTVADFRRKDIAYGGQGAPLVPAFHQHVFASHHTHRAIVNIGGISNVTVLNQDASQPIIGFDLGPGNVLLDAWINHHQQQKYDVDGTWSAQGTIHPELLTNLLHHDFFQLSPPKSTGREEFNLPWLNSKLRNFRKDISAVDVQATLVELTARSIIDAIHQQLPAGEILICGGGTHNAFLMSRLHDLAAPQFIVDTTQKYGLDPDWIEATAFAWLARQTLKREPGNLPSVTGAKQPATLGGIYYGF
ncbi:MAG: anhydro-N-acetylmuramic acid kinase [Gammaproteobacteria bacterium]|nr:anhydro-N-acetylmuramic acid kinase [Gammaproteobacteria bacterium]MCW5584369.1 anhydro-N-acetylmuramic acid kinase [Gammaproteobacteria bacterium]